MAGFVTSLIACGYLGTTEGIDAELHMKILAVERAGWRLDLDYNRQIHRLSIHSAGDRLEKTSFQKESTVQLSTKVLDDHKLCDICFNATDEQVVSELIGHVVSESFESRLKLARL